MRASSDTAVKRVERAANGFRRFGVCSFWAQLVLTTVSTVIVVFAILYRTATVVRQASVLLTTGRLFLPPYSFTQGRGIRMGFASARSAGAWRRNCLCDAKKQFERRWCGDAG